MPGLANEEVGGQTSRWGRHTSTLSIAKGQRARLRMKLVRHPTSAQAIRFVLAGGLNTAVTYLLYLAFLPWIRYELAYVLAYVIGVGFSYLLNARFVFRQPLSLKAAIAFPLVYVIQLGAGSGLLKMLVDVLGVPVKLAPLIVVALMLPVTFLLSRRIVAGKTDAKQSTSG